MLLVRPDADSPVAHGDSQFVAVNRHADVNWRPRWRVLPGVLENMCERRRCQTRIDPHEPSLGSDVNVETRRVARLFCQAGRGLDDFSGLYPFALCRDGARLD